MTKESYFTFTTSYMMQGCDYLYSGGENDPIVNATMYADEFLSIDLNGDRHPYVVEVMMPAQKIDRDVMLFEDKAIGYRRWDQRVDVVIKVFDTLKGYNDYLTNEYIKRYGE